MVHKLVINETTRICTIAIKGKVDFDYSNKLVELIISVTDKNELIGFVLNLNDCIVEISLFDLYNLIHYKKSLKLDQIKFAIISKKDNHIYNMISELCIKNGWNLYSFEDEDEGIDWMINS